MQLRSTSKLSWKESPVWLRVVWIIALTNFAAFWIIAVLSGGDAINGKEEAGRYFLMSHGRYTEVSKGFFEYSRVHTVSTWVTHAAAFIGLFWVIRRKKEEPVSERSASP